MQRYGHPSLQIKTIKLKQKNKNKNKNKNTLFFIQKKKQNKFTMAYECQIWYIVTRLSLQRNKDFFRSVLKIFFLI